MSGEMHRPIYLVSNFGSSASNIIFNYVEKLYIVILT